MSSGSIIRIYVPRDAAVLALGAETVATAIAHEAARRSIGVDVVRNGSRGLFWLEPLVEVETSSGRIAYGPVQPADIAALFDAGFIEGGAHALRLGAVDNIAYFKQQERLTFARVGIVDPASVEDYVAHGGYRGLARALAMAPADIVKEVTDSGLRGRGGAAFRPASSGRPSSTLQLLTLRVRCAASKASVQQRNTSSATPTRAIRARSPTACSWKAIRSA